MSRRLAIAGHRPALVSFEAAEPQIAIFNLRGLACSGELIFNVEA